MKPRSRLILYGALLCAWCTALSLQSFRFAWHQPFASRPVLMFTAGILLASVVSLLALRAAVHCRGAAGVGTIVLCGGITMRLILAPSHPVQELDIYRYMWDGLVMTETGNPWRFSPALIRDTDRHTGPIELQQLTRLRDTSPGIRNTLDRVHYPTLTTIYPPVSQAVFAAAALAMPPKATARTRLIVTRTAIVVFDVVTIVAILQLLRLFGKPAGWSVCYAWSPLVLKEFGNSGHLDAIAVCFCTWAIVFWIAGIRRHSATRLAIAAGLLGLATGAKLFPVVLVPVVAVSVWRQMGFRSFACNGLILTAVTTVSLYPMFAHRWTTPDRETTLTTSSQMDQSAESPRTLQTGEGIDEFLQSWKMNHFFFRLLEENLAPRSRAWFAITPESMRMILTSPVSERLQVNSRRAAFLITRTITTLMFIAIAVRLCQQCTNTNHDRLVRAAFLSLAWFWLLLPTMNPWYWIWAMPLLPFARQRTWLLMSGFVCIYYLRFWFTNSLKMQFVPGTMYSGRQFFQYVVVWVEYLPWCLLFGAEWKQRRRINKAS
ncbi:MAG: hypothetical protein ABGZ35_30760 [Planctomycetaceae bacterium]